MTDKSTVPIDEGKFQTYNRLTIAPFWKDPQTGALYVHKDLENRAAPWAEEEHIPPMIVTERFGDVESFCDYVSRFAEFDGTLLTWNSHGLNAVLDYGMEDGEPDRRQWKALYAFTGSCQWQAWRALASGQAVAQRVAVEKLEDLAEDIIDPPAGDLMNLLRNLRATVNATAEAELRPDGSTSVSFAKDSRVKAGGVELPPFISIAIPVLKGHVDAEGRPVLYKLQVRLRVSVDDSAHLALRFSIPAAERTLEDVYADRVKAAAAILGASFKLLRAAD